MPPQFPSSTRRRTLGAVVGLAAAPRAFAQQSWPERPIRFIVNAPPGGHAFMVAVNDLARSVAADFETMGSVLRSIGFKPEA
jgi:tripartite-type tricarboxylate transporter receptor subunit TctC